MVQQDPSHLDRQVTQLQGTVAQLQQVLRRMQVEQAIAARRRRRRLILVAAGVSIFLHIVLLAYLGLISRGSRGGDGAQTLAIEFASVDDQPLTSHDALDTQQWDAMDAVDLTEAPEVQADAPLESVSPQVDLEAPTSDIDGFSGSGDGLDGGGSLGGGGAGTSYFGISSQGTRFAYIVDRSGSMSNNNRMAIAMRELTRSLQGLPDYAYFHILLFSNKSAAPPTQSGWVQARRSNLIPILRWLRDVDATGGTLPADAFLATFEMNPRPDVIYFMTDGMVDAFSAEDVAALNASGKRVIVNTIAFGEQQSEAMLRQIADESGGEFRHVPDGAAQ